MIKTIKQVVEKKNFIEKIVYELFTKRDQQIEELKQLVSTLATEVEDLKEKVSSIDSDIDYGELAQGREGGSWQKIKR